MLFLRDPLSGEVRLSKISSVGVLPCEVVTSAVLTSDAAGVTGLRAAVDASLIVTAPSPSESGVLAVTFMGPSIEVWLTGAKGAAPSSAAVLVPTTPPADLSASTSGMRELTVGDVLLYCSAALSPASSGGIVRGDTPPRAEAEAGGRWLRVADAGVPGLVPAAFFADCDWC